MDGSTQDKHMHGSTDAKELEHLEHIEEEVKKANSLERLFLGGILRGIGTVIGAVIALALLGWVLSVFGVIPGAAQIANGLKDSLAAIKTR